MKNITPFFFSLNLLLAIAFGSCKPAPCPEYEVKVDTAFVPEILRDHLESYHGFDTLKFLTEKGDTVTFLGQGLKTDYAKTDNYAEDNCSTKSTTYLQFVGYIFYPIIDYPSEIQYYVSDSKNWGISFNTVINNVIFTAAPVFPEIGNSRYINNLNINGKTFNNVLKIHKRYDKIGKSFIYINKEEGIIQANFENGQTLTKIK